jgi:uncharacterized alpha-E superfamily protein
MPIIEQLAGNRQIETKRLAGELHAKLHYGKVQDIVHQGLNDFLQRFILSNQMLGEEIQRSFFSATS